MALPGLFPIYPDNILTGPYHVSLSVPGPISQISKSIGVTASSSLLIPNIDYLSKFIDGDIGIGDGILKSMMLNNFNSSEASSDENVFRNFAKLSKIEIDDINKYKKGGKFVLPESEIKISPELGSTGLKSVEKTSLKSIFETQKPYIEVAKITIESLAKIEDIIARIMPLISTTPLTSKSEKPIVNPNSLGYKNAEELKKSLSKIESILSTGGETKIDKDGKVTKNKLDNVGSSGNKWEIVSTVYSTGEFDPNIDYIYKYIDLPSDSKKPNINSELDLSNDDPYQKYKPKTIIFGIFDSQGNPLDPNEKLKAYSNTGNISTTIYKKADWIFRSPKWKFQTNQKLWPSFSSPIFLWERGLSTRESKSNPDSSAENPSWVIKKYKQGDKNRINGEDAIPGDPIIIRFETSEETDYRNYFTDLVNFRLKNSDLEEADKIESSNQILSQLDVRSHLENVFVYGQARSSYYKPIANSNAFPSGLKRSFKPFKIYSEDASNDEKLRTYSLSRGEQPGYIWIDPESDYLLKVIRVDPSTRIKYKVSQDSPVIESEIKSFVKNINTITISDSRPFNIEVKRAIGDEFIILNNETNITNYYLENWNYIDQDGLITQTGINQQPTLNNNISYKITIWSNIAIGKYSNLSYFSWRDGNDYVEINKSGDLWTYNKFKFDVSSNDVNINRLIQTLDNNKLESLYNLHKSNTNSEYSYVFDNTTYTIKTADLFSKKQNIEVMGRVRLDSDIIIEVNKGIIEKWFYMIPNDEELTYSNGDFDVNSLIGNGFNRIHTIDNSFRISTTDLDIPQFQIRVKDLNFPNGRIIDPSKILNDDLIKPTPFSLNRYGHGSVDSPQEMEIITRFMLTELDVESYYIIEGVLPEVQNKQVNNGIVDSDKWYRLPDAIGAIKVFINLLVDIFSKLIPNIQKLIKLFKNPSSFLTGVISEKLEESVTFLSKDSQNTYRDALTLKSDIDRTDNKMDKAEKVKQLKSVFKSSKLSNYVHVGDDGKLTSVLDGLSTIPFSIFGLNIPFGMSMDFNSIPKSPLKLVFPTDLKLSNVKNLQEKLKPKKDGLTKEEYTKSVVSDTDMKQPNLSRNLNTNDLAQIKFKNGSSILIKDSLLDEYIIDNSNRYNFIYLREDVQRSLKEVDLLIESGSQEDLQKAKDKLDSAKKSEPDNNLIDGKLKDVDGKLDKLKSGQQPMLKMILGIVTLPVKIIGGVIEWLMDFFKSLSNPTTLPGKVSELLSFKWLMQFLTPKGILETMGIKFKPEKISEWSSKVNRKGKSSGLPKSLRLPADITLKGYNPKFIKSDGYDLDADDMIVDLSEMLSVSFGVKLPKLSAIQHRQNTNNPSNILDGMLCFIEKIINSIIDFIWSTLGIEAVIDPPHIKLCNKEKDSKNNSRILNGEKDANLERFIYEVKMPDGDIRNFLNKEDLDIFIENNKNINYDFNF